MESGLLALSNCQALDKIEVRFKTMSVCVRAHNITYNMVYDIKYNYHNFVNK